MESKICTKCKQLKLLTEFYNRKISKNRLRNQCKSCMKKDSKKWRQQNLDHKREYNKKYRENNIDKDKMQKYQARWYQQNRKENTEYRNRQREYQRKYLRERLQKDIRFRLNNNISAAISQSLKGNKNGHHWENLINCTLDKLKICMEKKWTEGMTWDNYGRDGWVIDHIIPISAFNFSSPEHIDFKKCWALSNLQPMWADENRCKSNKLKQAFQPSLKL